MDLATALAAETAANAPKGCFYTRLTKEERTLVDQAFAAGITQTGFIRAMRLSGHPVGKDSVAAHRKNQCQCPL